MRYAIWAMLSLFLVAPLAGQSEDALRRFFEGKSVTVKIDLPATEDGVDVYADASTPLDYSRYATRLKQAGTAVRTGESIIVTKVRVKEKHIEFQLGGGGYGTFGDDTGTDVHVPIAARTQREKNLEKDVKTEPDPARKRKMQEELDQLRKERQREDARNRAEAADAVEAKKANIRQRAAESGSRFNVRYSRAVGYEELTPESMMSALSRYVEFPPEQFGEFGGGAVARAPAARPAGTTPAVVSGPGSLRKGASREEIEAALGQPVSVSERMEGQLKVATCTFNPPWGRVEAQFVEGVLIRFTVSSN